MTSLMDSVGRLIVNTLERTFSHVFVLYQSFDFQTIILTSLFLILSYRFLLKPVLGGHTGALSDNVRKAIKRDKEETSNG